MNKIIWRFVLCSIHLFCLLPIMIYGSSCKKSNARYPIETLRLDTQIKSKKQPTTNFWSRHLVISDDGIVSSVTSLGRKCKEITVPEGVESIANFAFLRCTNLEKVTLPQTLRTIGFRAFNSCKNLKKIEIPASVTQIAADAFLECDSLKTSGVKNYSTVIFDWWVKNHTYETGKLGEMDEIDLSKYTNSTGQVFTIMSDNAFDNCPDLKKLFIPKTFTSIGSRNFMRSYQLTSANVISHAPVLFKWWVENYQYPAGTISTTIKKKRTIDLGQYKTSNNKPFIRIDVDAFGLNQRLKTITIPRSIQSIGMKAFQGCESLTEINFSRGLVQIEKQAFNSCHQLQEVKFPDGLKIIGDEAFLLCVKLKRVIISDSVVLIGDYAFKGCENLAEIILPSKLKTISCGMVKGCKALGQIKIPVSVDLIELQAFMGCAGLVEIELPRTLKEIRPATFMNCEKLSRIIIPDTVNEIGEDAFRGCKNLKKLIFPKKVTKFGNGIFNDAIALEKIQILGKNLFYQKGLIDKINDKVHFEVVDEKLIDDLIRWKIDHNRVHKIIAD